MRARNLKPGFFKNSKLGKMPPLARLLFEGLWCMADGYGRLEDDPDKIKAEVLPYDDCDVNDLLGLLASGKDPFIKRYGSEKVDVIEVVKFTDHQNPHPKEKAKPSTFPESRENKLPEISSNLPVVESNLPEMLNPLPESTSGILNPEPPLPLPDILQVVVEDDFSEKPPKTPKHAGVYFDIDLRGDQLGEEEWLYRCMLEQRRSKNMSVMGCDSLRALLELYPNHKEHYRRWVTLPIEIRMAAFAYTYLKARASDPLAFAMWLIANRNSNDPKLLEFPKYLSAAKALVDKNELKVIIDAELPESA